MNTHGPADEHHIFQTPVLNQIFQILGKLCQIQTLLRAIGIAMASQIIGQDMIFFRKRGDLLFEEMAVAVPAMDEYHSFPLTLLLIIDTAIVFCCEIRHERILLVCYCGLDCLYNSMNTVALEGSKCYNGYNQKVQRRNVCSIII